MSAKISPETKRKAIVLGNNLSVVQDLGGEGVDCIVMNHHRAIATYSRYASYVQCPDPSTEEDKAIAFLHDFCRREGNLPVVMPVTDQWSMAVARHADRLREVSVPCTAIWEAVELMLHKDRFCQWAQERGIRTPRTWTQEELLRLPSEEYPVIVKPRLHRWSGNGDPQHLHAEMIRLRNTVIEDRWDLERFLKKEGRFVEHMFFQECVRGRSDRIYNIGMYIDRSSQIIASIAGHKIRGCMTNHGDTNLGERISPPKPIWDMAEKIVRELDYIGVVEFEFKQDTRNDEFVLIEVNPHLWAWCGIGLPCGMNFPLIVYQDLTGTLDPASIVPYEGKVRYARIVPDLLNCTVYCRIGADTPKRTLREWVGDMQADRLVCREFHRNDWLVSVLLLDEAFRALMKRVLAAMVRVILRPSQKLDAKYSESPSSQSGDD